MTEKVEFITFDVIGSKFRLLKTTFDKYPASLLYGVINNAESVISVLKLSENEFFVQRSPDLFKLVLQYVVCGKLHVPSNVCGEQLMEEFAFWRIQFRDICDECAEDFGPLCNSFNERMLHFAEEFFAENILRNRCRYFKRKLWSFVEQPSSSIPALIFSMLSMFFIVLSIVNVILISIPEMQFCPTSNATEDLSQEDPEDIFKLGFNTKCTGTFVFFVFDIICICWFTLELLLRLIGCPNFKTFMTSPMILIDIFAVLPFYIELVLWALETNEDHMKRARTVLMFLRILRTVRIFRICKLARYMLSLKILGQTLLSATKEFNMLVMFILMATFIFSNFLYQFEKEEPNSNYRSIPASFWWCIVTLTTVGYGDMTPQTIGGKIFASVACVCGIIIMAFPVAILVEKFMNVYKQQSLKAKYSKQMNQTNKQIKSKKETLNIF